MTILQGTGPSIVVVGGGISGLAAVWRLRELAPEANLLLLEASDRLGGVLQTVRQDGFLIERSADSFITDQPWGIDFCRRVGVEDQLIRTRPTDRRAYVVRAGRLVPVPDGFQIMAPARLPSVLTSPVLSWRGKLRLCREPLVRARGEAEPEESLAEFATRRLGLEAYQRLVQPLVAGIYAADPYKLSVAATMPRFIEMERRHGSLLRGMRARRSAQRRDRQDSGARYSLFVSLREGIGSLVDAVAAQLPPEIVRLNTTVRRVHRADAGWQLSVDDQTEPIRCDRLILATSSRVTSELLRDCDDALATDLARIPYGSCAVVCLGYRREQLRRPLQGFGFVVPAVENRQLLAASFASEKFEGRAPDEAVLVRAFIGGAGQEQLVSWEDDRLQGIAETELQALVGVTGSPIFCQVARWQASMPQYHVGHMQLVEKIESRVAGLGKLAVIGNAYRGVGIPPCIHQAEEAVERLL